MDLVNLMFIGSSPSLDAAFHAAGWAGSAPTPCAPASRHPGDRGRPLRWRRSHEDLCSMARRRICGCKSRSTPSKSGTICAFGIVAGNGTARACGLGRHPGYRHHVFLKPFGFTHQIEDDVDRERNKVVSDLVYTGCVDSVTYLRRRNGCAAGPEVRKGVYTDSRVAVVELNAANSRASMWPPHALPEPSLLVRCLRRVTLTARNHLLRDNMCGARETLFGWVLSLCAVGARNGRRAAGAKAGPLPGDSRPVSADATGSALAAWGSRLPAKRLGGI